jgi:hypothetical protein
VDQAGFIFTLKNPQGIPARRFALRSEEKGRELWSDLPRGPCFGHDIYIDDSCNTHTKNWTQVSMCYVNDTELSSNTVFTSSLYPQVKEIEVFEIID